MNLKKTNISQRLNKRKVIKQEVNNHKKRITGCSPDELSEILEQIENDSELLDKERENLKTRISKRMDSPNEVLERLEKDKNGEIRFWARDTRSRKTDTEGLKFS